MNPNLDPISFQSDRFRHADLALESCRETLARLGLKNEAASLNFSVPTSVEAKIALRALAYINVKHPEAIEAITGLVWALRSALKSCETAAA